MSVRLQSASPHAHVATPQGSGGRVRARLGRGGAIRGRVRARGVVCSDVAQDLPELKAYMVTQAVLASGNSKFSYGDCGLNPCVLGTGIAPADVATQTINRLLANPANGYHGVTPGNQGALLYPALTTPK